MLMEETVPPGRPSSSLKQQKFKTNPFSAHSYGVRKSADIMKFVDTDGLLRWMESWIIIIPITLTMCLLLKPRWRRLANPNNQTQTTSRWLWFLGRQIPMLWYETYQSTYHSSRFMWSSTNKQIKQTGNSAGVAHVGMIRTQGTKIRERGWGIWTTQA